MLKIHTYRRLLVVFSLLFVICAAAPAQAADDWVLAEVEAIRLTIDGLISELSYNATLDAAEVADLRADLSAVYRDLDRLADRLGRERPLPYSDRPGGWVAYHDVTITSDPPGAIYHGWQPKVKMSLEWGAYGVIEIAVIKNGYISKCEIFNAYAGGVNANLESHSNGDIIVYIADDLGSHEFLVENGGLGPVFVRGRDDYYSGTHPVTGTAWRGEWFRAYRDLVDARQLDESPEMEWLIAQYEFDDYDHPELRLLGERLSTLDPDSYYDRLGWMEYESGSYIREMDIPDPRLNPAGFTHFITKLHQNHSAARYWELYIP
jgi:hypothetical protein